MSQLNIKAFFFNAQTDYLPYYKNFTLTLPKGNHAQTILEAIQSKNDNFAYPEENLVFKINGLVVEGNTSIQSITEKLGTTLQIDPVKAYRSNNGLIINDSDFMQSFALLSAYTTEEDKVYYQSLYALHYASETENFDHSYQGDAILILAHKMIIEGSEYKEEILEAIAPTLFTCEYENNLLEAQDHTNTINTLKGWSAPEVEMTLLQVIKKQFNIKDKKTEKSQKIERAHKSIENLADKNIAYYPALSKTSISKDIQFIGANEITFSKASKLSGTSILEYNKTLALQKAGTVLLDAFDSGAEILVVEDEQNYLMFEKYFKKIEKIMGRQMLNFEIFLKEDFKIQCDNIVA